jgi:hypothetical protein
MINRRLIDYLKPFSCAAQSTAIFILITGCYSPFSPSNHLVKETSSILELESNDASRKEAASLSSNKDPLVLDLFNVYSPNLVLFNSKLRMYFGGWANVSDRNDGIYLTDCFQSPTQCFHIRKVIDAKSLGFEHLNDPSVVLHPSGQYYIMYMTGVPLGKDGFQVRNNKIYYSTSWAYDGVNWSKPMLLTGNGWLPSATVYRGQILLTYNDTFRTGMPYIMNLSASGVSILSDKQVLVNGAHSNARYLNTEVTYRPQISLFQILGERFDGTGIDLLHSPDGVNWHQVHTHVVKASPLERVRTPAAHPHTHSWVYYGQTTDLTHALHNKIRFHQW